MWGKKTGMRRLVQSMALSSSLLGSFLAEEEGLDSREESDGALTRSCPSSSKLQSKLFPGTYRGSGSATAL